MEVEQDITFAATPDEGFDLELSRYRRAKLRKQLFYSAGYLAFSVLVLMVLGYAV